MEAKKNSEQRDELFARSLYLDKPPVNSIPQKGFGESMRKQSVLEVKEYIEGFSNHEVAEMIVDLLHEMNEEIFQNQELLYEKMQMIRGLQALMPLVAGLGYLVGRIVSLK